MFLGKRFDGLYYWRNYGKMNNEMNKNNPMWEEGDETPLEDELNQFFYDHCMCGGWEPDCFEIDYEIEPEWKEWEGM